MALNITVASTDTEARSPAAEIIKQWLAPKPTETDRMFFTEQLSLLLETGTALLPALQSIRAQIENPGMATVIDGMIESVTEGKAFSQALADHPELFSSTYINLVSAAENGGFLHTVLLELMNMDEKREELRRTVKSALSYPGFLMFFSLLVVVFVLVVVFPKFADLFASIRDELPLTTLVLMMASELLLNHWLIVLLANGIVMGGMIVWLKRPAGRAAIDSLKLRLFIVKDIFIQVYLIQAMRVIGLSLSNGVSLPDALDSCREVVDNRTFQRFLLGVEQRVIEGAGFSIGFQEAEFIPTTVKQMITTGEETGNLPTVLKRIADHYERELAKKLAAFARMIEPIMLIVMGGVVGLIVSSLILPIFKLSRAVG